MNKKLKYGYAALAAAAAVAAVVVAAVPGHKSAALWTACGFEALAFVAQVLIWRHAAARSGRKSGFLGLSLLQMGLVYLAVQTVVTAVYLFLPDLPVWSAAVVSVLTAGGAALGLLSGMAGQDHAARTDQALRERTAAMRLLQADAELLVRRETDPAVRAALSALAEKLRFSDPVSSPELSDLEARMQALLDRLKGGDPDAPALIAELERLLEERNLKCRLLK